jgi:large subunit ribosomal protein L17
MRHRKKINHLGRQKAHRQSMLSNMASSLIIHKRIYTTVAKAKALRTFVEPLITKSKDDTTHSRRVVFSYLQDKNAVSELFREVSLKIGDRPGGYTRILKAGMRSGDSADMCYIELVDYNQAMLESAEKSDKKASRRRRGAKKGKLETPALPVKAAETKKEETITESDDIQIEEPLAIADEPITEPEEITAEQPVAEEPAVIETVIEEPVAEEPVAEEPVAEEPVAEEPVAEEQVAEEPVAEEPVAEEPVAEEPAVIETVIEEPVAEQSVNQEPVEENISGEAAAEELSSEDEEAADTDETKA